MRALCIVIDPPVFDDLPRFTDAGEPLQVQALFPEAPVETLDVCILGRLAGVDEVELDAFVVGPSLERAAAQFRAIINDQDVGVSPFTCNAL